MSNGIVRFTANVLAGLFGFTSGVIRNARTFHPDGRTFQGTVQSVNPTDPSLALAAKQLEGRVLMRIGMGVMKKGMPAWLANHIPDAPSIAVRFCSTSIRGELTVERREDDLDLLCTAGGDRLSKLIWNLATGGKKYGLDQFDYFHNFYYADVPYKIDDDKLEGWIRLAADVATSQPTPNGSRDAKSREQGLTSAATNHAIIRIEIQRVGSKQAPFVPIAEIRFGKEIQLDQEALHFYPFAARGFNPHGVYTELRKRVYPASVRKRAPTKAERDARENESIVKRLVRYFRK